MGLDIIKTKLSTTQTQEIPCNLEPVFLKQKDGRKFYQEKVFNKMKPNTLFIQVASHPLENYWIIFIDPNILEVSNLSTLDVLNRGGFETYGFQNWQQYQNWIKNDGK